MRSVTPSEPVGRHAPGQALSILVCPRLPRVPQDVQSKTPHRSRPDKEKVFVSILTRVSLASHLASDQGRFRQKETSRERHAIFDPWVARPPAEGLVVEPLGPKGNWHPSSRPNVARLAEV